MCLVASKVFLTYEKVVDVWQRNGPVDAKLFTWVTIQETSVRNCFRGLLTANSTKVRTVAFHLLGCCETLVIKSSYSVSSGGWLNYESARKYKRLRIQVWFKFYGEKLGRQILQYRTVYLFGFVASFQINRSSLNKTELLLEMPPETQNQPLPQCKPLWNSTTSFNNLKPVFASCRLDGRKMKINSEHSKINR